METFSLFVDFSLLCHIYTALTTGFGASICYLHGPEQNFHTLQNHFSFNHNLTLRWRFLFSEGIETCFSYGQDIAQETSSGTALPP